jgi:3,4-dihydroxy 2-butanone 4-phosphate synthase/GTP cyclohydrolase II
MAINPITDIIADLKAGRMIVLVDEEDRENEGDPCSPPTRHGGHH